MLGMASWKLAQLFGHSESASVDKNLMTVTNVVMNYKALVVVNHPPMRSGR